MTDCAGLVAVRDRVLAEMVKADFAGADPFDGLESRVFRKSGLMGFRMARLVWVQMIKRTPGWLRSLAMIPALRNGKTLALLQGAAGGVGLCDFRADLVALQNDDGGWGYPFAWQARAFYAKRGQSNAIVTSFVVDALMAGDMAADDPVMGRAAVFLSRLWRDGFFAYLDHSDAEVHNVSLWTAWALHRIDPANPLIGAAVNRVLAAQNCDGSWAYGTRSHHRFVDGFHTGYVLDLLDRFRRAGAGAGDGGMAGVDKAIGRGYGFYRAKCFDGDGNPRSFAGRDGFVDCHAVAQSIASLCRFGEGAEANRIAHWAVESLFDAKRGVFYAGSGRFGPDRRVYMRWTQAWMVWALSIVIEKTAMTDATDVFDPTVPLIFPHPDPARPAKEDALRALSEGAFRDLFKVTRIAAQKMRANGDMEALYGLTRGLKTLQRIGGERGIVLLQRRVGFQGGEISTPDNFDNIGKVEIDTIFQGDK